MKNLFRIAFNAFRESLREPVYCLMLLASLMLIAFYPSLAAFAFMEPLKLVIDSSMATGLLSGLIVAVLCASNTVAREMRNGTVLLLLSKPVSRWNFVLGKTLGITAAVALFAFLCNLGCIISTFVSIDQFRFEKSIFGIFLAVIAVGAFCGMAANFVFGSSFMEICTYSLGVLLTVFVVALMVLAQFEIVQIPQELNVADLSHSRCLEYIFFFKFKVPLDLFKALMLINFAVIAMATIAVTAATRLDVVPNMCVCTAVFFMGLLSSYLFRKFADTDSGLLKQLLTVLYSVFPNWQFFWLADALAMKKHIPAGYVGMSALYMALFIVIASLWAVVLFREKEVAGDSRN